MVMVLFNVFVCACLLITAGSNAQSIKTPEFPAPERLFYDLLEEDKVTDSEALNGRIKEVEVSSIAYGLEDNETYRVRIKTLLDSQGHITHQTFYENGELVSILNDNKQEIDSLDGYLIITVPFEEYGTKEFWYKRNQLVKQISEQGIDDTWEELYTYDFRGRPVQKRTYKYEILQDENNEPTASAKKEVEAEIVTYDGDLMMSKVKYVFWDEVIDIYKITYQYDSSDQCSQYDYSYDRYMADNVDWGKPLELQVYDKSDQVEGEETNLLGKYTYNDTTGLKTFVLTDKSHQDFIEKYKVSRSLDKMTVDASLQNFESGQKQSLSKVRYQYTYDEHKNPINIVSYKLENGEKKLDKETTLAIIYYE